MYNLEYDLVIADEEFTTLGSCLTTMAEAFETKLDDYASSLSRVTGAAVKEGVVAENLVAFSARVEAVRGEATRLSRQLEQALTGFVDEIDRADSHLY